jgi:hypothetical protein
MSNSQARENPRKPRDMPTIKIGETPTFFEEHQTPEHATVRKRELQKHLIVVIGANLTNLGITNLGVIVARQNKDVFPSNAPKEFRFYLLSFNNGYPFYVFSMVCYPILDHSRLIRETECTVEMIILVVGFVLSSFLMIGFIQLHCAMFVLVVGIIVIYIIFFPAEFSSILFGTLCCYCCSFDLFWAMDVQISI